MIQVNGLNLQLTRRNNDNELRGKTKTIGYNLALNFNHWIHNLQFNSTTGYFLKNTSEYIQGWNNTLPYIQFPSLKVISFQGANSYKLNSGLSLNAVNAQTEIQLKSAGSFILGIAYSYNLIDNKSKTENQQSSQRSNTLQMMTSIGYAYSYVINKSWYATGMLLPSYGLTYTDLLTRFPDENIKSDYYNGVLRLNAKLGIGYNSERFFGGGELNAFRSYRKEDNTTVTLANIGITFQVFIGYRFKAPEAVKKIVEKMEAYKPF